MEDVFNLNNKNIITFGTPGSASKSISFKENEFKKELAPINARIEHREVNGEKIVTMTYRL